MLPHTISEETFLAQERKEVIQTIFQSNSVHRSMSISTKQYCILWGHIFFYWHFGFLFDICIVDQFNYILIFFYTLNVYFGILLIQACHYNQQMTDLTRACLQALSEVLKLLWFEIVFQDLHTNLRWKLKHKVKNVLIDHDKRTFVVTMVEKK